MSRIRNTRVREVMNIQTDVEQEIEQRRLRSCGYIKKTNNKYSRAVIEREVAGRIQ